MRIDRLDLIAFGPFTDAVLDLSGGSEGLHLVYGPNEAGKSSALRAIKQLFCSIPHQSADNFVHKHTDMRVGAVLRGRDGTVLEVVRRKGTRNTLLTPDGAPVDDAEARLSRALGGVDPLDFLRKFVIDHAELVEGGRGVVEGRGDLGRLLFSAGSGFAGLGAVQKAIDEEADRLFKPRASNPVINAAMLAMKEANDRRKVASLRSTEWREHDEALTAARARKEALGRELDAATRERNRLQRLAEARGPVVRRGEVVRELETLADVPRLRPNFGFERRDARTTLIVTEQHEGELRKSIAELSEGLEALEVPGALLAEAEAVEALYLRHGRQLQASRDRDRLSAGRAGLEAEARAALKAIGRDPAAIGADLDAADLEPLRPRAADRAELRDLAGSRQALEQGVAQAIREREKHDAKRAAASEKLAALGPARDHTALKKAVTQARAPGDLDARLRDARAAVARDARRAANALAALGRWSGPLDALESLPVPPAETLERFRDEFDAAGAAAENLRRRLDELGTESRQTAARLEQLRLSGETPTEDALADARARRDALWRDLAARRDWDDALASAFEPAVRRADDLADRLRREANRVAERAGLLAESARQASARDDLVSRVRQAETDREALSARWSALWSPLGVSEPGTPAEMLAWLRKEAKLAEDARSLREARDDLRRLEDQAAAHRLTLGSALSVLGEPPAADAETLGDLIERADEAVEAVRKNAADRKRLADQVEGLDRESPELDQKAASERAAWSSWQARWAAVVGRIGLPGDTSPTVALAVLEQTDRLFDKLDQARALRRSLDEAAREAARFAADVRALAGRVAPHLVPAGSPSRNGHGSGHDPDDGFDPGAVAAALNDRLRAARDARLRRDALSEQLREREEAARAARETIRANRATLAALAQEARCDSADGLPAVEERAARRLALEQELAALNDRLRALAVGSPFDGFLAQSAAADPDDLALDLARLNETVDGLGRERERVDQAIGREESELGRMDGNARAADAGQEAEDLRARVKADVEQYARLRLASAVLRAGIERYRKKAQDPVLARASGLFAGLTLGSFEGLRVDYDDRDEPVLKGVRPGGREALGVEGMSLGTADQLYLALRLAALEADLDRREPLPLVVDDVLIQFDDARAGATLDALAALSRRTQVLVFTHHRHLLDLASARVAASSLIPHTL